jgi:hypothetical protein
MTDGHGVRTKTLRIVLVAEGPIRDSDYDPDREGFTTLQI